MPPTDPIADFLTRIRNASMVGKVEVTMPFSKVNNEIATLLAREGYIQAASHRGRGINKEIVVEVRYIDDKPAIENIKRISKPGRRVYRKASSLRVIKSGLGMSVVSTPKGMLTDKEARNNKVGGEIVCEIW